MMINCYLLLTQNDHQTIAKLFKLHIVDDIYPSKRHSQNIQFRIQESKARYCNDQMSHYHFHIKVTEQPIVAPFQI